MNLNIHRERRFSYAARYIKVYIDGIQASKVRNGGDAIIPLSPGEHNVLFQIGGRTMATASIYAENSDIFISCWANATGVEACAASPGVEIQFCHSGQGAYSAMLILVLLVVLVFLLFLSLPFRGFIFIF